MSQAWTATLRDIKSGQTNLLILKEIRRSRSYNSLEPLRQSKLHALLNGAHMVLACLLMSLEETSEHARLKQWMIMMLCCIPITSPVDQLSMAAELPDRQEGKEVV